MAFTARQRFRYRFDNLMARGTGAQIAMLGVATVVLILVTAAVLVASGLASQPDGEQARGFGQLMWDGLMHTLDAGTVAGDGGVWAYRALMLATTVGGIFVLSALIGILTGGFGRLLDDLRKGRSLVVERDHTVVLGYTPKIHTVISQLAEANANRPGAAVVVLAEHDKVAMDDEIRERLDGRRLRVITRSGSPMSIADLQIANLDGARSVIVLSPERDAEGEALSPAEADTVVLKTLLAIAKHERRPHVVAELQDERTRDVARMVLGESAALIVAPPLIGRLLVQTGRQVGLSAVYSELLDFEGSEVYVQPQPTLEGRPFADVLCAYDDSAVIGILTADEQVLIPPAPDRALGAGEKVIAIAADDDRVIPNGRGRGGADEAAIVGGQRRTERKRERTLVLGGSERLALVLADLDTYVAPGSETLVVGEDEGGGERAVERVTAKLVNMKVAFRAGDITNRDLLESLEVHTYDHALVMSEVAGRSEQIADARTMITLLHLRDISRRNQHALAVTTEMLDGRNRELAAVAEADDFIISNTLVSLLVTQVSENRHLVPIFDELLSAKGYELYLKPATEYVRAGAEVDFYTVMEAALRRGEVAVGYRIAAKVRDATASYGVVVNPTKSARVSLGAEDRIIVLAED